MKDISRTIQTGILGMLAGGALGLAAGLLIAPEKGRKTRRRLMYQFENAALRAGLLVEQWLRSEDEGEARRTGDALVEDAQVRAELIRKDIEAILNEMRR